MKQGNPPIWAENFFAWICHHSNLEGLEGDLFELFDDDIGNHGLRKAKRRYVLNMITLMRPSVVRNLLKTQNNMDTLLHYLKAAYRTTSRSKGFSAVSILGLIFAFTSAILVGIYSAHEYEYDEFRENKNSVYRIYNVRHGDDGPPRNLPIVPPKFSLVINEMFPQAKNSARILNDYGGTYFQVGEKGFSETNGFFAEPAIIDLLEIKIAEGSVEGMNASNSVLFSKSLFSKLFGEAKFDNQAISISNREVKILGVYEDVPLQSHIRPDYIFSFETAVSNVTEERMNSWQWQQFYTYVQLNEGQSKDEFENQFQEYIAEHAHPETKEGGFYYIPYLQNVAEIHLHSSNFNWEIAKRGNYQAIVFIMIAAGILLLIALFNFVNLFSVQTIRKLREFSIRKTVGAFGSQITSQLIVHSGSYIVLALMISVGLAYLMLPTINSFLGEELTLDRLVNWETWVISISVMLFLIILCTLYPIIISRRFKPAETIKGIPKLNSSRVDPRMIMVGIQYVLSVGLIFSSIIIQQQYELLRNTDMGFNPDRLVSIAVPERIASEAKTVKNELLKHANIESISVCYGTPGGIIAGDGVTLPSEDKNVSCNMIIADHDYVKALEMEIVAGRDFNDSEVDLREGFIINETAVTKFGFGTAANALEKEIDWFYWGYEDSLKRGKVIGVVKDFNFKSLHNAITPIVLHIVPDYHSSLLIRIGGGDLSNTIAFLEEWWKEAGSERPLQYEFVDDLFASEYKTEQQLNSLFMILTIVAILMAAIGIFSLVTFNVNSRLKEISIRKVLGAKVSSIIRIVTQDYILLASIAMLITLPICTYILGSWLNDYAFRINIGIETYLIVATITLLFTIIIIGKQAWNAANNNPVKNLRND